MGRHKQRSLTRIENPDNGYQVFNRVISEGFGIFWFKKQKSKRRSKTYPTKTDEFIYLSSKCDTGYIKEREV